jgi:hypothetical protein
MGGELAPLFFGPRIKIVIILKSFKSGGNHGATSFEFWLFLIRKVQRTN